MKRKVSLKYVLTQTNENRDTSQFSFQSVANIKTKHYTSETNVTIPTSLRHQLVSVMVVVRVGSICYL